MNTEINSKIEHILRNAHVYAVVGLSSNPSRTSYRIASDLIEHGRTVVPVNPAIEQWQDRKCYPDLKSIPVAVDVVNIFRRSEFVSDIVDEAIAINAKVVWMQIGVIDEAAAERALSAGLDVVMDRCISIEMASME